MSFLPNSAAKKKKRHAIRGAASPLALKSKRAQKTSPKTSLKTSPKTHSYGYQGSIRHARPDNNNDINYQNVDFNLLAQYPRCLVNFVDYQYDSINVCHYIHNYCVNTNGNGVPNNIAGSVNTFGVQAASVPFVQGYYQAFSGSATTPLACCNACAALPLCAMSEFDIRSQPGRQCLLILSTHATCAFGDYTGQATLTVSGQTIAADTGIFLINGNCGMFNTYQ
ncbi:hypothetical protein FCIRC_12836 [Fusarium circinatum]|uniref:Uncharacterized protein n=1 Tax=Fusarium circinatum TaxID=48490 RepID=A0A8H5SWX6_FUSCI|nr:hypothetical protein FCIRC_12836 [Fusarium circinatum]